MTKAQESLEQAHLVAVLQPIGENSNVGGFSNHHPNQTGAAMLRSLRSVIRSVGFLCLAALLPKPLAAYQDLLSEPPSWPDIQSPGLDLGDFPNSAFTIPAGTWQMEFAPLSFLGPDQTTNTTYSTQYLLRYGVTEDVEFRLFGNGISVFEDEPTSVGFSPVVLNTKIHLWDEKQEYLLPAMAFEVLLTTDWGSQDLSSGYQPTLALNFDYLIRPSVNLEWTIGYSQTSESFIPPGLTEEVSQITNQAYFQWAIAKDLNDQWQFFTTGQTLERVAGQMSGTTLAFGGFWKWSDRLSWYGLGGWGVTSDAPAAIAQIGLGYAFGTPRNSDAR